MAVSSNNPTPNRKTRMIRAITSGTAASNDTAANNSAQVQQSSEETVVNLKKEISEIMRGFGDCDRPLPQSVQLVEKILQQQLRGILKDATDLAMERREAIFPIQTDFEYMMRLHPVRLNRMRKHIKDMRRFRRILQMQYGRPFDDDQYEDDENESAAAEQFDEEKIRRLFRADRISQILIGKKYEQYNEARRTSFYGRKSDVMKQNFKNFLGIHQDSKIPISCLNILAYLAHETIATIMDYAILTRLTAKNRYKPHPYSRVATSGSGHTMLHVCPDVTQGRGLEGIKAITVREIREGLRRHAQMSTGRHGVIPYTKHYLTSETQHQKNYLAM